MTFSWLVALLTTGAVALVDVAWVWYMKGMIRHHKPIAVGNAMAIAGLTGFTTYTVAQHPIYVPFCMLGAGAGTLLGMLLDD